MKLFKLEAQVGTKAQRIPTKRSDAPGLYVATEGVGKATKVIAWEVKENGDREGITVDEAERRASAKLSGSARVAHEITVAQRTSTTGIVESELDEENPPQTAREALARRGHDFDIEVRPCLDLVRVLENQTDLGAIAGLKANEIPGMSDEAIVALEKAGVITSRKRVVRADTKAELSVMGIGYAERPARSWFGILDPHAKAGRISFGQSYVNEDSTLQSLSFHLAGSTSRICRAGGTLSTSHNGFISLTATATVTVPGGYTVYAMDELKFRHTLNVDEATEGLAKEIIGYVIESAEAMTIAAANAVVLDSDTAAAAVIDNLEAKRQTITKRAKLDPMMTDEEKKAKIAEARAEGLARLHTIAARFDAHLGGLRYVLAAGVFSWNETQAPAANDSSWHYGVARDRATDALLALANVGGELRAVYTARLEKIMNADPEVRRALVEKAHARLAAAAGDAEAA